MFIFLYIFYRMKLISTNRQAFLAGLFEGDAFLGPSQCKVVLCDEDVVSWVADVLETNVSKINPSNPERRILYETSLGRQEELSTLYVCLYPWFGKRRQSQLEASFCRSGTLRPTVQSKIDLASLPQPREMPPFYRPSLEEWAYFTGYFVAEGSIAFDNRSKQPYSRPSLHLSSTDQDVIAYSAKLISTPYTKVVRPTKTGKDVFVLNVTNFEKLDFILNNILPFILISARHTQKVRRAFEEMRTRIDWRTQQGIQKTNRLNLQDQFDDFDPAGDRFIDWEGLALIFQSRPFLFMVKVPGSSGVALTPRLRIQTTDLDEAEKVAKIFEKKVRKVRQDKKTLEWHYEVNLEKKKYVFWILAHVLPFLSGEAHVKAKEALDFLKSPDFTESKDWRDFQDSSAQEVEAFKPAVKFEDRSIDWEDLALIFQHQPFVFIVNVPSKAGVLKTPRLRIQSHDLELVEKVSKIFQSKVFEVTQSKVSEGTKKEILYSTQIEKKKSVFFLLKNVLPFLSGDAAMKAQEALDLLK